MNQIYIKNSHCSYCGTLFLEQIVYPRHCLCCDGIAYSNPTPAVITLINVWDKGQIGVLIQKRNIEPKRGQWAFAGGYMENGETWEQTAAREVFEEIGLQTDPEKYQLIQIKTSPISGNLLIFGRYLPVIAEEQIKFMPNDEVSAIKIAHRGDPIELAFPLHTELLQKEVAIR
jgi:8-oxo-dGTP pyrophosphatase MutT (NUDIX family)